MHDSLLTARTQHVHTDREKIFRYMANINTNQGNHSLKLMNIKLLIELQYLSNALHATIGLQVKQALFPLHKTGFYSNGQATRVFIWNTGKTRARLTCCARGKCRPKLNRPKKVAWISTDLVNSFVLKHKDIIKAVLNYCILIPSFMPLSKYYLWI